MRFTSPGSGAEENRLRPPRVSVSAWGLSASDLVQLGRDAEDAGFDGLWIGDHVVAPAAVASHHPGSVGAAMSHRPGTAILDATTPLVDPFVALTAVAAVTSRLRLGTAVLVAALRHPLLVARAAHTLQGLAGGRLRLGLAAGWMVEELAALGASTAQRGRAVDEAVTVLRGASAGGFRAHRGEVWAFDSVQVAADPWPLPLFVGGSSPVALRRAAEIGDGWFVSGSPSLEATLAAKRLIDERREELGLAGPFEHVARVSGIDSGVVAAHARHGFAEVAVWADEVWAGRTPHERRAAIRAAARTLGIGGRR